MVKIYQLKNFFFCFILLGCYPQCGEIEKSMFSVIDAFYLTVRVHSHVNKAVYTAVLVADGWAEAENLNKGLCDGWTYGQTDVPTNL